MSWKTLRHDSAAQCKKARFVVRDNNPVLAEFRWPGASTPDRRLRPPNTARTSNTDSGSVDVCGAATLGAPLAAAAILVGAINHEDRTAGQYRSFANG